MDIHSSVAAMSRTQSQHLKPRDLGYVHCHQMCNPVETGPVLNGDANNTSQQRTEFMEQPTNIGDAASMQRLRGNESSHIASQVPAVKQAASSHRSHRPLSHRHRLQQADIGNPHPSLSAVDRPRETCLRPHGNFPSSHTILRQDGNTLKPHGGKPLSAASEQNFGSIQLTEQLQPRDPGRDPVKFHLEQSHQSHTCKFQPSSVNSDNCGIKTLGQEIAEAIVASNKALVDNISAPKLALLKYDGNPRTFLQFWNNFINLVDNKQLDYANKLQQLYASLTGRAETVVRSYLHEEDPKLAYEGAKLELTKKCGNKSQVAIAALNCITHGKKIQENDIPALEEFVSDLRTVKISFQKLKKQSELDSYLRIVQFWERLPGDMQEQWMEHLAKKQYDNLHLDYTPSFQEFHEFVEKQLLQKTLPGYYEDPRFMVEDKKERNVILQVHHADEALLGSSPNFSFRSTHETADQHRTKSTYPNCAACRSTGVLNNTHLLVHCEKFKSMSHEERLTVIIKYRVCRNCLSFSNHLAARCKAPRRPCTIPQCKERHHTLFHFAHLKLKEKWKEKAVSFNIAETFVSESIVDSHSSGKSEAGKCPAAKHVTFSDMVIVIQPPDPDPDLYPKQHYPWYVEAYIIQSPEVTDMWKIIHSASMQEMHITTETTVPTVTPRVKEAVMSYSTRMRDARSEVSLTSAAIQFADPPEQNGSYVITEEVLEFQFKPRIEADLLTHGYAIRDPEQQLSEGNMSNIAKMDYIQETFDYPRHLERCRKTYPHMPMEAFKLKTWQRFRHFLLFLIQVYTLHQVLMSAVLRLI